VSVGTANRSSANNAPLTKGARHLRRFEEELIAFSCRSESSFSSKVIIQNSTVASNLKQAPARFASLMRQRLDETHSQTRILRTAAKTFAVHFAALIESTWIVFVFVSSVPVTFTFFAANFSA